MHIGARFFEQEELQDFGFKYLGKNVQIKRNVGIFFTENVSIGDNVRIDDFSIIVASREPVIIGSNTNMAAGCYIAGSEGFEMKEFSTFAPGVKIFSGSDDYLGFKLTGATVPKEYTGGEHGKISVGKHCIIGTDSVVLPDLTIEEGVAIGALSLVKKDLPAWGVYAGNPLRRIKERRKDLLELERKYLENFPRG